MNLTTRTALAQLLAAAGATLNAFAAELGATPFTSAEPEAQPETPAEPAPVKTRKPREPKAAAPAAEPVTEEPTAVEQPKLNGKTYDDMKAVIEPLVKEGRGAEVKAVITKYAPTLKEMDPSNYAAFEKEIEALSY